MSLPTLLTYLRVALIPVIVLVFYLPFAWSHFAAALIFSIASITDWLDGYYARKLGMMTKFGAFLDPVADKLIVIVVLTLLIEAHASPWMTIPAFIIIMREVFVSALREWMAEKGKRGAVAVSFIGKAKTTAQITALIILLLCPPGSMPALMAIGMLALYIAALLTLWSMAIYIRASWDDLVESTFS